MFKNVIKIKNQTVIQIENEFKKNLLDGNFFPAFQFEGKKIKGILTLGDLRRLIKRGKLEEKAKKFINKRPVYFYQKDLNNDLINNIKSRIKDKNLKNIDDIILVDKSKRLLDIFKFNDLKNSFKYKKICVVGAGHIGLPLTIFLSLKTSGVNLYDKDKKKINLLKKNKFNFYEKNLDKFLISENSKKKINYASDIKTLNSQIYIVCVGTILKKNKVCDNKLIINVIKQISKVLKPDDIIILRGTVQVGFTSNIAKKIIEENSNFKVGKNVYLGFMPERLLEGDSLNELNSLPQIISGVTNNCLIQIKEFSSGYFNRTIVAKSTEEAEIIKLCSNSFRDLNFSFANEISRLCEYYNLSANELIEKSNFGYSRNNIPLPSIGVGGFCLPKDPYIFSKLINKKKGYKLSHISREINDHSIDQAINKLSTLKQKYFNKANKLKMLILGVAFKGLPETIDLRNSPSINIYESLKKKYDINLYDINGQILRKYFNFKKLIMKPNLNSYDLVLIINKHPHYSDLFFKNVKKNTSKKDKILFDPWNIADKKVCKSVNWLHVTI
tara:strand:+ start:1459 stop:3126 length:1668 start_codon:yes stop_codon:yes gene_type:complete